MAARSSVKSPATQPAEDRATPPRTSSPWPSVCAALMGNRRRRFTPAIGLRGMAGCSHPVNQPRNATRRGTAARKIPTATWPRSARRGRPGEAWQPTTPRVTVDRRFTLPHGRESARRGRPGEACAGWPPAHQSLPRNATPPRTARHGRQLLALAVRLCRALRVTVDGDSHCRMAAIRAQGRA
jgi:hypothetical protein